LSPFLQNADLATDRPTRIVLGQNFPQVLAAAREGADWAWVRLYRDLAPSVLGYLRARGGVEPDDLTGEVFLQVVRDLRRFDGGEREFRAWIFTIAHHRLIDDARQRARRPVEPAAEVQDWETPGGDAQEEVLRAFATERVRLIIEQLAPEQRDVLLLRVLGGLTVSEVAKVVGKSSGAVKALQRRGLAGIRRALSEERVPL
jgi:RNA polymerase sigma-70 factor (ECF subfamily)